MTESTITYTKEKIKERLLAQADLHWRNNNSQSTDLDPFVDLLFGAFASEMERINNQIESVESRVVKRVLDLIIPEASNKAQPAYSVINISPKYNEGFEVSTFYQFSHYSSKLSKEFYFTPAGSFKLIDGEIKSLSFANKSYQYNTPTNRVTKSINWRLGSKFPDRNVWVGIKLNSAIATLEGLCLYMDWQNQQQKTELLNSLHDLKIYHNNLEVPFLHGIKDYSIKSKKSTLMQKTEQGVRQELNKYFITIESNNRPEQLTRANYPKEWEQILPIDQLAQFSESLVWLKLVFPPIFNVDLLDKMTLLINCIPVLNRRVHEDRFQMKSFFNVFPFSLETNESFFDIINVTNSNGIELTQATDNSVNDVNTYILRTGGVARFDNRNALESLNHILNLFRDEAYAFIAAGAGNESEILKEFRTIQQLQTKIYALLPKNMKEVEGTHYMVAQTTESSFITCQYWTTNGIDANYINIGESLLAVQQGNLFDNICFVQPVKHGRGKLSEKEHIALIKRLLLSRNQIVTHADLKIAILNEWKNFVIDVSIEKQIEQLTGAKKGIRPVLMITLFHDSTNRPPKITLEDIETSVYRMIEEQSVIPINSLFSVIIQWKTKVKMSY